MKNHAYNIERIKAVYDALGELKDEVVFVGGATVSLYADRMADEVRETIDVDIVVEVASNWEYAALEEKLRALGFSNDTSAGFIGRYILSSLIVDVMPTSKEILGFFNTWYALRFKESTKYKIDEEHIIKIFPAPIFIASKIEAFKNWLQLEFTALLNNPYMEEWIDAHVGYNASPSSTSLILQDLTKFTQSKS